MKHVTSLLAATLILSTATSPAQAHDGDGGNVPYASDHAPIGVMADHRHTKGEWMLSYRFMHMDMEGNRDAAQSLTPEQIATTAPNPFGMPPTLRVVPTQMTMRMHMLGGMYGLTDKITLMAMGMVLSKEMDHITFQGGMGTTRLGEFETRSSGIGDTTLGVIYGLDDGSKDHQQVNAALAISVPTGSNTQEDDVLTPMNTRPTLRLPYPMQISSGTFDLKPSITGRTRFGDVSLGGQASAVVRLNRDNGYRLGNGIAATAWAAYEFAPWVSASGRLEARHQATIRGQDPRIMAPVQTADPENQGGESVSAFAGINLVGQSGAIKGHRLALEIGLPLYRNLNGPQLETDLTVTVGWQKAF